MNLINRRWRSEASVDRLPPGQYEARGWPVLQFGAAPEVREDGWTVRAWGEVAEPSTWTLEEFKALPTTRVTADFHCVTKFSVFDNDWFGVSFRTVAERLLPTAAARHVVVHGADHSYSANLPLDVVLDPEVLFAWRRNGEDLTVEHGWPLRLVVPKRYAWKSVKWVTGIEVLATDRRGFWEERGYHNEADPWREQRYSNEA